HLVVYHVIWCPKRRRNSLPGPIHDRLAASIHEVAEERHWQVIRLAIQPDPVPLFLRAHPYLVPTDIARPRKGRSSRLLREEFPALKQMPSLWTRSYVSSTAGTVSSETIQRSSAAQRRPWSGRLSWQTRCAKPPTTTPASTPSRRRRNRRASVRRSGGAAARSTPPRSKRVSPPTGARG